MVISGESATSSRAVGQGGKRARTRAALVAAARGLFASHGVDAVRIEEIVAAAEVAKGTFYNHFTDKDDLAREVARDVRGELEALVASANAAIDDPAERVARGVATVARFAREQPERARAMTRLFAGGADPDSPMNRGIRHDIAAGLAASRFDGAGREAMVLFVIGTAQALLARVLDRRSEASVVETASSMTGLLLRGLGVEAAAAASIAAQSVAAVCTGAPAATTTPVTLAARTRADGARTAPAARTPRASHAPRASRASRTDKEKP